MEKVLDTPSSTTLFRQLSSESGPVTTVLDPSDTSENRTPEMGDLQIEHILKDDVEEDSSNHIQKDHSTNSIYNPAHVSKMEHSVFINDLKRKMPPKLKTPTKEYQNSENLRESTKPEKNHTETNMTKVDRAKFVKNLEENLKNKNKTPIYLEMKSPPPYENVNSKELHEKLEDHDQQVVGVYPRNSERKCFSTHIYDYIEVKEEIPHKQDKMQGDTKLRNLKQNDFSSNIYEEVPDTPGKGKLKMEEVMGKPSSVVLYRQLSSDSEKVITVLDPPGSCQRKTPKIIDMKIKRISRGSVEEGRSNSNQDDHLSNRSDISSCMSKIENSLFINDLQKELSSNTKKESIEPEKIHTKTKMLGVDRSKFARDLEEKLKNKRETNVYMEMKSPTYGNVNHSESQISEDSAKHDQQDDEVEMRHVYPKDKVNTATNPENSGQKNLSTATYEYIQIKEESENPVALIKALKMKPQNSSTPTESKFSNINKEDMATLRPKSPKPIIAKNEKEESFWDKIGTLGRKKRIKEVQEVQEEGKYAIDSPGFAVIPTISPEDYDLEENEERSVIMPKAFEDPKLRELMQVLIDWINDELASQRIIVQDLTEDLYDGQVLQKLFEMLTGHKLDVPEVTQSEEGQKQKLSVVLSHFNRVLGLPHNHNKWNVEVIHSKSIVPILHLLVALARHFRPPVRLPENVSVSVTVVQKTQGQLMHRVVREVITSEYSDVGMRCERDAFDTLFDHAPDKLQVVKKSMVTFVNKHLNKLNLEVTEIESQFHDGVYLIMLMGLLEGFFVPLYSFFPTPKDHDQKVHNVSFAFELMEEVGLARPKARPEDVVNLDLKSTLRVLYNLFNKYKSLL